SSFAAGTGRDHRARASPWRASEILGRAGPAGPRAASRGGQDLVLSERACGELDDLLSGGGTGADGQDALAAPSGGGRDPAVAGDRRQPGDARRALAERRDRRVGVRDAVGANDAAARRTPVSG